ncbi:MAG: hypothetical protein ABII79_11275 [bacterium]
MKPASVASKPDLPVDLESWDSKTLEQYLAEHGIRRGPLPCRRDVDQPEVEDWEEYEKAKKLIQRLNPTHEQEFLFRNWAADYLVV